MPTPSRSSTAAIVRHRFPPPRDFLLTGLRPESSCLIRELIQEKRPTRLLSQTGPRIPSAGADAGRAFPGCLNRPVVEERHLQATANCLPIMRCEIRCSNPSYCLARVAGRFPAHEKTPVLQGSATGCDAVHPGRVPKRGLEQSENSPRRVQVSRTSGAKSGAVDRENARIDPELAQVIEVWDTLPSAIREAILAMLRAVE